MLVTLRRMTKGDISALLPMMKRAFDADSQLHLGHDGGPEGYDDGSFLRKWSFEQDVTSFSVFVDSALAGAVMLFIRPSGENHLGCIFIDPDFENKSVGTLVWRNIEAMYPQTQTWTVQTPAFSSRNHHFYINKLGFSLVKIDMPRSEEVRLFSMKKEMKPKGSILVQGAVDTEVNGLISRMPGGHWEQRRGLRFYIAAVNGKSVIVSVTGVGITKAAIATTTALDAFSPIAVINLGTAGGHTPNMARGDIVLGESSININCTEQPIKAPGEGSNALEWSFSDSELHAYTADSRLLEVALSTPYCGRLVRGRLGAGDIFSRETDRINQLQAHFGHLCEDMESAAVYEACALRSVPVLGVRIIANNELIGDHSDHDVFMAQKAVLSEYTYTLLAHIASEYEVFYEKDT